MEYRVLGRTGLKVSEIGFGCGNVGGLMIRGSHSDQVQAVNRAIELGINYFDTASRYGEGASESNLGTVLERLRPTDIVVATKVGLQPEDSGNIRGAVRKSLEGSLRRLKRESVDVFLLHAQIGHVRGSLRQGSLGVDDVLGAGGVADVLDELRSQRLIGFSGFTGLGEPSALHEIVKSGKFDVVQAYYNLLNPSAGFPVPESFTGTNFKLLIVEAANKRMGIAVIRSLAGGALGGSTARQGYASPTPGALVEGNDYVADNSRAGIVNSLIGDEMGSPAQVGIRFVLMNKDISTVLVGFSDVSQIEEAADCSGKGPIPREFLEKLQGLWATDFMRTQYRASTK